MIILNDRNNLKIWGNIRRRYYATFSRWGTFKDNNGNEHISALFINVKDKFGTDIVDHCWIKYGNKLNQHLKPNDKIIFTAKVVKYTKKNGETSYSLKYVSKLKIVNKKGSK